MLHTPSEAYPTINLKLLIYNLWITKKKLLAAVWRLENPMSLLIYTSHCATMYLATAWLYSHCMASRSRCAAPCYSFYS